MRTETAEEREMERPSSVVRRSPALLLFRQKKNLKPPSLTFPATFSSLKPICPKATAVGEKRDGHSLVRLRKGRGGREGGVGAGGL